MSDTIPDPCHEQEEALLAWEIEVLTPALQGFYERLTALQACRQANPWPGNWLQQTPSLIRVPSFLDRLKKRVTALRSYLEKMR